MGKHVTLLLLAMTLMVTACKGNDRNNDSGNADVTIVTAATLGEQTVRTSAEYLAAAPYAGADPARGENHARVCRACHSLQEGGQNMIGPALYGFFGAPAGSRAGFDYSSVFNDADFVWTPRALDAWLAQPGRFLPGNRMSFAG
ncbi:MAG: cytochrome c family protein, partial [Woeseiaceae bacterium]|nr:cytochrome c family protein [Woeseiaceae bacterium]